MKRPPFLRLIFLPALLIPVQAQPPRIHCRFVSIEKSGTAAALQSLPDSGLSDSQLFESLMRDVAQGRATIVADQQIVAMGGTRSKVEAVRRFPVPVEAEFESGSLRLDSDDIGESPGQIWETEGVVSDGLLDGMGLRVIDLNMAPQTAAFLQRIPCPVPVEYAGQKDVSSPLSLPLMAVQKTATQLLTWTGNTVLLSVSPGPADSLKDDGPSCRYQFIRAGLDGEKPVLPEHGWTLPEQKPSQARLHLVTFRLPAVQALSLTLNGGETKGRDAALYHRLRGMAADGQASVVGCSAAVIRASQRGKIEAWTDYPILTEFLDGNSVSWEYYHMGESFEAELSFGDVKRRVVRNGQGTRVESFQESRPQDGAPEFVWNLALERSGAVEEIPAGAAAADVEFLIQKLSCQLRIPPSGILQTGLISQSPATRAGGDEWANSAEPAETTGDRAGALPVASPAAPQSGEAATADITFALQSPASLNVAASADGAAGSGVSLKSGTAPAASASTAVEKGQVNFHVLMLSLPESEGRQLAVRLKAANGSALPASDLVPRLQSGEISCAAQFGGVIKMGQMSKVSAVRRFLEESVPEPVKPATPQAAAAPGSASASGSGVSTPPPPSTTLAAPVPPDSAKSGWARGEYGLSVEAEASVMDDDDPDNLEMTIRLDWDTAPLLTTREATASGQPRRCPQRVNVTGINLHRGQPVIADIRPSNARPGTPEHGRWHALLLIAR